MRIEREEEALLLFHGKDSQVPPEIPIGKFTTSLQETVIPLEEGSGSDDSDSDCDSPNVWLYESEALDNIPEENENESDSDFDVDDEDWDDPESSDSDATITNEPLLSSSVSSTTRPSIQILVDGQTVPSSPPPASDPHSDGEVGTETEVRKEAEVFGSPRAPTKVEDERGEGRSEETGENGAVKKTAEESEYSGKESVCGVSEREGDWNEWDEEIDGVLGQNVTRSGHGHAPGETGISTHNTGISRESRGRRRRKESRERESSPSFTNMGSSCRSSSPSSSVCSCSYCSGRRRGENHRVVLSECSTGSTVEHQPCPLPTVKQEEKVKESVRQEESGQAGPLDDPLTPPPQPSGHEEEKRRRVKGGGGGLVRSWSGGVRPRPYGKLEPFIQLSSSSSPSSSDSDSSSSSSSCDSDPGPGAGEGEGRKGSLDVQGEDPQEEEGGSEVVSESEDWEDFLAVFLKSVESGGNLAGGGSLDGSEAASKIKIRREDGEGTAKGVLGANSCCYSPWRQSKGHPTTTSKGGEKRESEEQGNQEDGNNFISKGQADNTEMHQRLSSSEQHMRLRSVLKKSGHSKKRGRNVTFNETLNIFYEAECSCWVHEDEYARLRQEEHERREREELFHYEPPPMEFEDPPTLSPPEGYKDRFFPSGPFQELPIDPDVTRVPSPPTARRKIFLTAKDNPINGQEDDDEADDLKKSKSSRLGGILKGGRLWRSNSAEGKKVTSTSPPEEPDVVKCTESSVNQSSTSNLHHPGPTKVSTGTAPLRTSEQIRLAVHSHQISDRFRAKKKPECSSLVEKLRWLTSLDDDDSSDSNASGFATWPSREKNGTLTKSTKTDAGTSTTDEFVQSAVIRQPPINSANEAKIKQISYTLEDIDEGLKSGENELESFITEDGGRIERLRKRYGDDVGGDDYGFSRRPSVKGIKPKFSSTNQIFAQFTMRKTETPIPTMSTTMESQYENTTRVNIPNPIESSTSQNTAAALPQPPNNTNANTTTTTMMNNHMSMLDNARIMYEFSNAPGRQTEESRTHFFNESMIRQSFGEPGAYSINFNRPHSWSVSTLPHPHHHAHSHSLSMMGQPNAGQPQQQLQNGPILPNSGAGVAGVIQNNGQQQQSQQQGEVGLMVNNQPTYGTMLNNGGSINQNSQNNLYGTLAGPPPHSPNPSPGVGGGIYGTLPHHQQQIAQKGIYGTIQQNNLNGPGINAGQNVGQQQPQYGTVGRRVPNVIGRPLFLHYGALSVEAHPNKIVYPRNKVPETPSPTQHSIPISATNPPNIRYYGPPIRYPPPPVPPRTIFYSTDKEGGGGGELSSTSAAATTSTPSAISNMSQQQQPPPQTQSIDPVLGSCKGIGRDDNEHQLTTSHGARIQHLSESDYERGVPEGATDEEPTKEPYSMNV